MLKVVTAPQEYIKGDNDVLCFLAGGIQNCHEWQNEVIKELDKIDSLEQRSGLNISNEYNLIIFNPRRANFPIGNPNAADEQITWEFNNLERMDIFSMYFCGGESDQPICMYELGRNLVKMKERYNDDEYKYVVIGVEQGYKRKKDVEVQTNLAVKFGYECITYNTNPKHHAENIYVAYKKYIAHEFIDTIKNRKG